MRTKNELLNDYTLKAQLEALIDIRDVLVELLEVKKAEISGVECKDKNFRGGISCLKNI